MLEGVGVAFEIITLWRGGAIDRRTVVWKPFVVLGRLCTACSLVNWLAIEVCCTVASIMVRIQTWGVHESVGVRSLENQGVSQMALRGDRVSR